MCPASAFASLKLSKKPRSLVATSIPAPVMPFSSASHSSGVKSAFVAMRVLSVRWTADNASGTSGAHHHDRTIRRQSQGGDQELKIAAVAFAPATRATIETVHIVAPVSTGG